MKIVQSFWSLPCKQNNINDLFGRNGGGWISEKYHAMSWALSCLKFKGFYRDVELNTDFDGARWLIDELNLPYSNVVYGLNQMPNYDPSLWALAKIFTISQQNTPFLHVDSDVYIWEPFKTEFINNNLCVQNIEYEEKFENQFGIYINSITKLKNKLFSLPKFIEDVLSNYKITGRIEAYNTGIVGGQNLDFLKLYSNFIFEFLNTNKDRDIESSDMNLIEQLFLFCLAQNNGIIVKPLFGKEKAVDKNAYFSMAQFNLTPLVNKYIHVVGQGKKNNTYCSQVALRLRYEFPKMYNHILSKYKEGNRYYFSKYIKKYKEPRCVTEMFPNTCLLLKKIGIKYPKQSQWKFENLITRLLNKEVVNRELLLLHDLFQIEKYYSDVVRPTSIKDKQLTDINANKDQILNILSKSTFSNSSKYKFTLNKPAIKIAYLNFDHPQKISFDYLHKLLSENKTNCNDQNNIVLLSLIDNQQLNTLKLSDWNLLLCFFDGEEISAEQLLKLLKDENMHLNKRIENLEQFAFSFITINSLYFNYLRLVA